MLKKQHVLRIILKQQFEVLYKTDMLIITIVNNNNNENNKINDVYNWDRERLLLRWSNE